MARPIKSKTALVPNLNKDLFLFYIIFHGVKALSCASCGSGGDDPLVLNPSEDTKVYVALVRSAGYRLVLSDGDCTSQELTDVKYQLHVSAGKRWTSRIFSTVFLPYVLNYYQNEKITGFGDPSLSFRYTVVQQNFLETLIPQVQILASYKRAISRSPGESQNDYQLDVFGSGFSQSRYGIDFWSGLTFIQYGFAFVRGYPYQKTINEYVVTPGVETKSTVTVGQSLSNIGKYAVGMSSIVVDSSKRDGEIIDSTEQKTYNFFSNFDFEVDPSFTLRFGVSKQGGFLRQFLSYKNTTDLYTFTLAYMQSW